MYVGRIVAIGKTVGGYNSILYRVSSRSFPNRQLIERNGVLVVEPRQGFETDTSKNPYIAYNAIRLTGSWAIASNGSHTDAIADRISEGMPVRQALALCLMAFDYEKDEYNTPRIAAVAPKEGEIAWLGIVRHDSLEVKQVTLQPGKAIYIATYLANAIISSNITEFDAHSAEEAAQFIMDGGVFGTMEHPITGGAALMGSAGFTLASRTI
jgi:IMP cyclohydrolase